MTIRVFRRCGSERRGDGDRLYRLLFVERPILLHDLLISMWALMFTSAVPSPTAPIYQLSERTTTCRFEPAVELLTVPIRVPAVPNVFFRSFKVLLLVFLLWIKIWCELTWAWNLPVSSLRLYSSISLSVPRKDWYIWSNAWSFCTKFLIAKRSCYSIDEGTIFAKADNCSILDYSATSLDYFYFSPYINF